MYPQGTTILLVKKNLSCFLKLLERRKKNRILVTIVRLILVAKHQKFIGHLSAD